MLKNLFDSILIAYDLLRTLSGHGGYVYYVSFDSNDILAVIFLICIRDILAVIFLILGFHRFINVMDSILNKI